MTPPSIVKDPEFSPQLDTPDTAAGASSVIAGASRTEPSGQNRTSSLTATVEQTCCRDPLFHKTMVRFGTKPECDRMEGVVPSPQETQA